MITIANLLLLLTPDSLQPFEFGFGIPVGETLKLGIAADLKKEIFVHIFEYYMYIPGSMIFVD